MKIKTRELAPPVLDWVVAKLRYPNDIGNTVPFHHDGTDYGPSRKWAHGGPIIEEAGIEWQWLPTKYKDHQYGARKPSLGGMNRTFCMDGPTILVAAMRCYVASRLGDEVDVPDELLEVT